MSQQTSQIGANKTGLDYRTEDNAGKKALLNHHKGSTAPSYAEAGMIWLDDAATPWVMKMHDGTDWISIGNVNATTNEFTPFVNGAALGAASDTATGLVERATDAEASAGTDTTRYVTPKQLADNSGGLTSVSQGDLNTSTGTVSASNTSGNQQLVLPGGEYGFYPNLQYHVNANITASTFSASMSDGNNLGLTSWDPAGRDSGYSAAITLTNPGNGHTTQAKQRYITASPPFDLGDGEAQGFVFVKVNASGDIVSTYLADVPPWAYNGPTKITPDFVDKATGKKFISQAVQKSLEEIMDTPDADRTFSEMVEITQEIKNADMNLIPHPFLDVAADETVVLIDPMCGCIGRLIEAQNLGEDILRFFELVDIDLSLIHI